MTMLEEAAAAATEAAAVHERHSIIHPVIDRDRNRRRRRRLRHFWDVIYIRMGEWRVEGRQRGRGKSVQ